MDGWAPTRVRARAEGRGEEEPRAVELDGAWRRVSIARRWREPHGRLFEVDVEGGPRLLLLCREPGLEWWLQRQN